MWFNLQLQEHPVCFIFVSMARLLSIVSKHVDNAEIS